MRGLRPIAFLCLLIATVGLNAQGVLRGSIDSDEGAVIHLNVVVEQNGRFISATSTDGYGRYQLPPVPEGDYDLTLVATRKTVGSPYTAGQTIPNATIQAVPVKDNHITVQNAHIGLAGVEASEPVLTEDTRDEPVVREILSPEPDPVEEVKEYEAYDFWPESGFSQTSVQPRSTFSSDADHAFYTLVRRMIRQGYQPPAGAVRIEEMLNHFSYNDPVPTGKDDFAVTTERATCPWNPEHDLLRVGIQAREVLPADLPPSHLVFLVDVSGSMEGSAKLPLARKSLHMLVDRLRPEDHVSLVTYSSVAKVVMEPVSAAEKDRIHRTIASLKPSGATSGEAGLRKAYELANQHYVRKGNNRILVCTDGDFNVGVQDDDELGTMITQMRNTGVYLSVLGFGSGNYKDSKLEILANRGNGQYLYIDDISAAEKALLDELGGSLLTVGKDLKIQVHFDEGYASAWRLIGYENRLLTPREFRKSRTDAGDIGAGHHVTALYELIPATERLPEDRIEIVLKWRDPVSGNGRRLIHASDFAEKPIAGVGAVSERGPLRRCSSWKQASADFRFASAVAEFGLILRESDYVPQGDLQELRARAAASVAEDRSGYRRGFVRLVDDWIELEEIGPRPLPTAKR